MNIRKKTIWIILTMIIHLYSAQLVDEKFLPNITPPSSSAYSLGKFGNIEIGEFTGSPNINIPLLFFKGGNMGTDLSLSYTSSGIKVDEKDGYFGLGWTLITGGVINRIVRDKDDFSYSKQIPPESFDNGIYDPKIAQFFYDAGNGSYDTEADLFSFTTGNISGQFIINNNGEISLLSKDDLKFQILKDKEYNPYFLMTDSKGVNYYFTAIEKTFTRLSGNSNIPPSPTSITAWFLSKIENTDGEQVIFEYEEDVQRYTLSQSQMLSYSDPYIQPDCKYNEGVGGVSQSYVKSPTLGPIILNEANIFSKRLKKILSNRNTEEIELKYNKDVVVITHYYKSEIIEQLNFHIDKTYNGRFFLSSIKSFTKSKDYKFEYIQSNLFPSRLSFSQDHWGYFNGKANVNIVPKNFDISGLNNINYNGADKEPDHSKSIYGVLSKIFYPTKGYTLIDYEPNSYYDWVTIYPTPKNIREGLVLDKNQKQITKTVTIQSVNSQEIKIQGYGSFNSLDCDSSLNMGDKHRIDLSVKDLQTNQFVQLYGIDSQGNGAANLYSSVSFANGKTDYYNLRTEAGKSYEFKIYANKNCTNGSIGFTYYDQGTNQIKKNIVTGGNRVAKMIDFDGNQQIIKRYYYASKDNLNQSSGSKGVNPSYRDFRKWETDCVDAGILRDAVITSSSIFPLFDSGKSNVYYKYVTISLGGSNFEKGGIEKEFTVNRDYWGNQLFGSENAGAAPWTNFGWDNGYLKKEKIFDNKNNILKINDYTWEKKDVTNNKSFYIRKNYTPKVSKNIIYTCTNDDVIRDNNGTYWVCTTDHNHLLGIGSWKCTLPDSQNELRKYNNPCFQQIQGYQIVHTLAIENLDIVEYNNISYRKYLKQITSNEYLNNQLINSSITENLYDNNLHYQITGKKNNQPDASIIESKYQYAHEKNNQKLINANMVGIPLETTVIRKQNANDPGKMISKTETKYDDPATLFPTSTVSYDLQGQGNLTKEVVYDKYDSKGNLQQYTQKDGISTTIIWGYNQTQPIAKIEGAKMEEINSSFIEAIVNASNMDAAAGANNDETNLLNAFKTFRQSLPDYKISTYTYDPLIGVRSITLPSGIRENYLYDFAGRLEKVIDANGRIVKEMKYNYKN